jgi:hypothetical protein
MTVEILEELAATESLPIELKLELERRVLALCHADSDRAVEWIGRYNDQLHNIVENDEEIKSLARENRIEEAAALTKEKLDSWFGHDVAL